MKRFLGLVGQTALISSLGLTTVACSNPLVSGDSKQPKPPDPVVKDISYYQELIKEIESYIADCAEILQEIKDSSDDYDDEQEYQEALDEVTAEKFFYQAQVSEFQGAILFLEVGDLNFTTEQVVQGIAIFSEWVSNLSEELQLKEKYSDCYGEQELAAIEEEIELAKGFLEFFLNLRED